MTFCLPQDTRFSRFSRIQRRKNTINFTKSSPYNSARHCSTTYFSQGLKTTKDTTMLTCKYDSTWYSSYLFYIFTWWWCKIASLLSPRREYYVVFHSADYLQKGLVLFYPSASILGSMQSLKTLLWISGFFTKRYCNNQSEKRYSKKRSWKLFSVMKHYFDGMQKWRQATSRTTSSSCSANLQKQAFFW